MVKEKWRVCFRVPALAYVNGLVAPVLTVVVGGSVVGVAVVTLASAPRRVHFQVPTLAYANGPVALVLTVVVGRSVVGVVVVGVEVVTLASAPRPALENRHAISLSQQNVYVAMLFKLLGWAGRSAQCALRASDKSDRI